MEHIEAQRNKGPRASVPQFGVWDQKKKGALESSLGYTVVFTKARADRQHQKNDLSDVKRQSHQQIQDHLLYHQDNLCNNNNNKHKAHQLSPHEHKKHDRRHGKPEEEEASDSGSTTSDPMGKKRNKIISWFLGCYRP